ncbi:MAG: VanZ family protein [Bacilli bacterium]|nr:VanZ family protein [Bacilli bacterium]
MFSLPKEAFTIINGIWPMLLIFIVVLTTIRINYILEKGEKFVLYKEFFSLAFVIYILLLFELVTNTDVQSYSHNFVPFKEILRYEIGSKHFYWNVVGNIMIFMPFGFFISLYLNSQKLNRPLIITFITSLTIELVQMFIGRSFDVDDILLNCVGGVCGFLLFIGLSAIKRHLPKFLQRDIVYNILTGILIIFIIFYILKFWGIKF